MIKQSNQQEALPEYLHGQKASEIFLEYAIPAINMALEDLNRELKIKDLERILVIPGYIWNKVVAETAGNISDSVANLLRQAEQTLRYNIPPGGEEFLYFMRQRKINDFKKYHYYIRYTVHPKSNNELGVRVEHSPATYNNVVKF